MSESPSLADMARDTEASDDIGEPPMVLEGTARLIET
jgi:hypothetical protein